MRTIYLKITYDAATTTAQRVTDAVTKHISQTGMLPGAVVRLNDLPKEVLATKAANEAFENSFEGRPKENYSFGYIDGYNAALERGEE